jgi:hypothetical protein
MPASPSPTERELGYRLLRATRSMARFQARLDELGATLLEDTWLGCEAPHRVLCPVGHEWSLRPSSAFRGRGACLSCAGKDPRISEAEFRARLTEMGATLVEQVWLGVSRPHRAICVNGHECGPRPYAVLRGQGICVICAGLSPRVAEAKFRARLAELGATLLEPEWLGNGMPHRVRCKNGHECKPRPSNVAKPGRGVCRICAGKDSATAEAAFRSRLTELGATLLEPKWLGISAAHRILCAAGHESAPRPGNVSQGRGICRRCAGLSSVDSQAAFRRAVTEAGAVLLEPTWRGVHQPHRIRCVVGHQSAPHPSHVQEGGGVCATCAGKAWDAFYVVADDEALLLKFGITTGTGKRRLSEHRRDGFATVHRFLSGLPDNVALSLEREVLSALRLAGEKPVRGREYYPARVNALVLDIVDHCPSVPRPR